MIPKETHFAALVTTVRVIHHEGDKRSRTNPGHGYPAYDEKNESIKYIPFKDQAEMENWVLAQKEKNYTIIKAMPVDVKVQAVITYPTATR